jgi:hypothetical protein
VLRWWPPTVAFGTVTTTAATASATLTNFGDVTVSSISVQAPTGFTATPVGCTTLDPGATCQVNFGLASSAAAGSLSGNVGGTTSAGAVPSLALSANLLQAASCKALKTALPSSQDGAYTIDPDGAGPLSPVRTYCDMTTDGGGWTLIEMASSTLVLDATYWSIAERNTSALGDWGTSPNTTARMSADAINAICKGGDGYVRHRYANNTPGFMLTDYFAPSLLSQLDIARMLRGDTNFNMGFSNFGNGSTRPSSTGQWKRFNSYLTDNLVCTDIHSYCGGVGTPYTGWGPLCDSYNCNKSGQRVVDGHMWWAGSNAPAGVPGPTYATYGNYGSRWCR